MGQNSGCYGDDNSHNMGCYGNRNSQNMAFKYESFDNSKSIVARLMIFGMWVHIDMEIMNITFFCGS